MIETGVAARDRPPVPRRTCHVRRRGGRRGTPRQPFTEPHAAEVHDRFRWDDRIGIPALLACPGVAGAWTFSLPTLQKHPTLAGLGAGNREFASGSVRIRLPYLDADPAEVTRSVVTLEQDLAGGGAGAPAPTVGETLFDGPLRTIIPWQDR